MSTSDSFAYCTRRYIEGFDILYSTNRFHISGMNLIQHFPRLLPTQGLSYIHSVEMRWDLGQVAQPPTTDQDISAEPRFGGWRMFLSLLDQLPKALPHLRYLHLTLRGDWFPPQMAVNDLVRHSEPAMLQPIDRMVRELYRTSGLISTRYIVAIPANVFQTRMSLISPMPDHGSQVVFEPVPNRRLVWRSLEPKSFGQSDMKNELGYWLEDALDKAREQASSYRVTPVSLPSLALAGDW